MQKLNWTESIQSLHDKTDSVPWKTSPYFFLSLKNKLLSKQQSFIVNRVFFLFFHVLYSTLHLQPLRFHCVGGYLDRILDYCDFGIDSCRSNHLARSNSHSARSHPLSARSHPLLFLFIWFIFFIILFSLQISWTRTLYPVSPSTGPSTFARPDIGNNILGSPTLACVVCSGMNYFKTCKGEVGWPTLTCIWYVLHWPVRPVIGMTYMYMTYVCSGMPYIDLYGGMTYIDMCSGMPNNGLWDLHWTVNGMTYTLTCVLGCSVFTITCTGMTYADLCIGMTYIYLWSGMAKMTCDVKSPTLACVVGWPKLTCVVGWPTLASVIGWPTNCAGCPTLTGGWMKSYGMPEPSLTWRSPRYVQARKTPSPRRSPRRGQNRIPPGFLLSASSYSMKSKLF